MRAAIYARKSTDDQRDDLAKSISRQVEQAREYAARQGWTVSDDHVFVDDGISGGEFWNRPGLARLLTSLKPAAPFDVVLMTELSRLGRDRLRTEVVARDISDAGVRIIYHPTGEEERLDSPEGSFIMAARGFAAEVERAKARQRTRDAMQSRAKRGHVTGGVVYGYRNVPVYSGTDASGNPLRSHVRHEIEPTEAAVVRGMFRMFADGYGLRTIAQTLNGDERHTDESIRYFGGRRVSPPRKGSGSWAPSGVNAMLLNERYRGVLVWGKHRNTDKGGKTRQRVPQDERGWVSVDSPDLRIVDDALWNLAQSRRQKSTRVPGPRAFRVSQSLLSGIGSCGLCSAPIVISGPSKRSRCYACGYHRDRGRTICANSLLESSEAVDRAFIAAIEDRIFTPEFRASTVDEAVRRIHELSGQAPTNTVRIEQELSRVKREVANLIRTLEAVGPSPSVTDRLRQKERETVELERSLASTKSIGKVGTIDFRLLDRVLADTLGDLEATLRDDVVRARAALSKLLVGRVLFQPTTTEVGGKPRRTYRLEASLAIGRLLVSPDDQRVQAVHVPDGTWTVCTSPIRQVDVVVPAVKAA